MDTYFETDYPPPDFVNACEWEEHNGFGFQLSGHQFVLGFISKHGEGVHCIEPEFRAWQAANTEGRFTYYTDFIGRYFVGVHWREYARIPVVINSLAAAGFDIRFTNKLGYKVDSSEVDRVGFKWEHMEFAFMHDVAVELGAFGVNWLIPSTHQKLKQVPYSLRPAVADIVGTEDNWHTTIGRDFARTVAKLTKCEYIEPGDSADRFSDAEYMATCDKYGLFHKAAWAYNQIEPRADTSGVANAAHKRTRCTDEH